MQRVSAWTDLTTPDGQHRYGSLAQGVPPTPLKAEWLNMMQEELAHVVLAFLPALDKNDSSQLLKALQAFGAGYAVKATTLAGYGIVDAYTKSAVDWLLSQKANNAITLGGYGITDAYTKAAMDTALSNLQGAIDNLAAAKQDKNTALMAPTGWRLDKATGLLEQWGNGVVAPDSVSSPVNFPTPFAEVYNCFGNKITPNSEDGDANGAGVVAISATQYRLFNDTVNHQATVHWRAIGRAPGY
jgi:phage-related tail fiber protein